MITGKTSSGFEFEIDEESTKNYRFVKATAKAASKSATQEERIEATMQTIPFLLGEDQEEKLVEHLESKAENGIATVEDVMSEVKEIMEVAKENKTVKNS